MHAPSEKRTNWGLGLRALLAAASLAGIASASGSVWPMVAAVLVAGWALVGPLKLASRVLSVGTLRGAGAVALRLALVAAAATVLSFAVNNGSAAVSVPGTLLFLGLLGVVGVTAMRWCWARGRLLGPRAWATSLEAAGVARGQALAVWLALRQ